MLIPPYICNKIIAIRRFNMNLGIKAMTYHPQVFLGLVVVMRVVCRKVKYRMLVTKYLHMKVQFNRFSRVWYMVEIRNVRLSNTNFSIFKNMFVSK